MEMTRAADTLPIDYHITRVQSIDGYKVDSKVDSKDDSKADLESIQSKKNSDSAKKRRNTQGITEKRLERELARTEARGDHVRRQTKRT